MKSLTNHLKKLIFCALMPKELKKKKKTNLKLSDHRIVKYNFYSDSKDENIITSRLQIYIRLIHSQRAHSNDFYLSIKILILIYSFM